MWHRQGDTEITCIACGETLTRADAREYDKYGDRWDRRDKEFEHLCKPCYRDLCHQPRQGLESLLIDIEDGSIRGRRFVERYYETLRESVEGDDHERGGKR